MMMLYIHLYALPTDQVFFGRVSMVPCHGISTEPDLQDSPSPNTDHTF